PRSRGPRRANCRPVPTTRDGQRRPDEQRAATEDLGESRSGGADSTVERNLEGGGPVVEPVKTPPVNRDRESGIWRNYLHLIPMVVVAVAFVGLWELVFRLQIRPPYLLPSPSTVARALYDLWISGALPRAVRVSEGGPKHGERRDGSHPPSHGAGRPPSSPYGREGGMVLRLAVVDRRGNHLRDRRPRLRLKRRGRLPAPIAGHRSDDRHPGHRSRRRSRLLLSDGGVDTSASGPHSFALNP